MMKHRKISKKKALKNKILKITSVFVIAGLVMGGFFVNAPKALADNTGTLYTVSNGTYTAWTNGEASVDDEDIPATSISCSSSDAIRSVTGGRESFTISLASVPNGRTITSINVTVRDRGHSSAGGTYKTFTRLDGSNTDASANLTATGGGGTGPCSVTKTQIIDVPDVVKSGATTLEIGVVKVAGNSNTVRVGTITAIVAYSADTTAPVISLTGATSIDVAVGDSYTDEGAMASDDVDGDITASIITVNPVNTAVVAPYTITYDVFDSSGNSATQVSRTVNVIDTISPVVTLIGANPQIIEVGTAYTELGATVSDNYDTSLVASIDTTAVDTAVVGPYTVTYDAVDLSGNNATQITRTVNVVDTTAPVIALMGSNPFTHLVNTSYSDDGATATDNYDGDLTFLISAVSTVNADVVGSYTVKYNVTDANSNVATEITRTVNVVDTTAPVINLDGVNPQIIEVGTAYSELGATVTDDYDTGLTADIDASEVDTSVVGSYTVTYDATDFSDNEADQITRTVNVVDTTVPVITLVGDNPQVVEMGTAYSELGATVTDNYDIGMVATINATTVDTAIVGSYTVTYNVTDSNANVATEVTRTVNVVDTIAPVITVAPYTTAQTNIDITVDVSTNEGTLNTSSHLFTENDSFDFVATDASGNVATQTVTITNIDKIEPVITLLSINPFNLTTGDSYTDPGAVATDNADGDITASIVTVNPVDTAHEGIYTITYNVTDAAGNAAEEVTRTAIVTKPVVSGPSGATPDVIPPAPALPTPVIPAPILPTPTPSIPTINTATISPPAGSVLGEKITLLDELIASLKPFKRNPKVKQLQTELKKLGLFNFPYFTTYYGPITNAGVKKYLSTK